jgi:20S proteasome subunit beta 6
MDLSQLTNYIDSNMAETALPSKRHDFNPYEMNGGMLVALAGEDYALIASDTRLSSGFVIHSRSFPHVRRLSDRILLGAVGFQGDVQTLVKMLDARLTVFRHEHGAEMSSSELASMLSNTLYYRRFFPYYVYNLLVGLDSDGHGAVYSYDPVGSYEREAFRASGSADALLQPVLDSLVGQRNRVDKPSPFQVNSRNTTGGTSIEGVPVYVSMPRAEAVRVVHDAFVSAAEREISVGDSCEIHVLSATGVETIKFPLRRD